MGESLTRLIRLIPNPGSLKNDAGFFVLINLTIIGEKNEYR